MKFRRGAIEVLFDLLFDFDADNDCGVDDDGAARLRLFVFFD